MSTLKRLAGDTAIYGLSSIVARVINYLLVPVYTRKLTTDEFGIYTEFFAYIPFFLVILTFGFETGFFRFANKPGKDPNKVFSTSLIFLFISSLIFLLLFSVYSQPVANLLGYPNDQLMIKFVAAILAIDSFTAILFSRLRYQQKALKFATFRTIKILMEVAFNFILFFYMPGYFERNPDSVLLNFLPATPGYQYIITAVFLSCIGSLFLFIPDLLSVRFYFSKKLLKELLIYSIPLMIAGLPGIANDFIGRILFRFFATEPPSWLSQLGVFNANTKLAVFMILFIQMFRYAAEPFFFSKDNNSKETKYLYADVMKYFCAFCMFIFLLVTLYIDLFSLFIGEDFRIGLGIVPIMLFANIFLGMVFNLSFWYKTNDKTHYGLLITCLGLLVTLLINVIFMPVYGAYAAAWAYLLSYVVMALVSYLLGNKFYPVPYNWKRIFLYFGAGLLLFAISWNLPQKNMIITLLINTFLLSLYLVLVCRVERINPLRLAKSLLSFKK